jgi:hypothetical protein
MTTLMQSIYSYFRRYYQWIVLLGLLAPNFAWADKSIYQYYLSNIGDQGSVELVIGNTTTYQKSFEFGPKNGKKIKQKLNQFEQARYIIQCHKRNDLQSHPQLSLKLKLRLIRL